MKDMDSNSNVFLTPSVAGRDTILHFLLLFSKPIVTLVALIGCAGNSIVFVNDNALTDSCDFFSITGTVS